MRIFFFLFAFYLDGLLSNYAFSFFFFPLFSITLLFLDLSSTPLKEKNNYLIAGIYGAFYDLIYTSTFGFSLLFFLLLTYLTSIFKRRFLDHIGNIIWELFLIICLYWFLFLSFQSFFTNTSIPFSTFLTSIFYSLIPNFLFLILFYIPVQKYHLKK